MKSKTSYYTLITAAAVVMMLSSVNQVWASTLSGPRGLALDSKGNLYIANESGNKVVVYSPTYVETMSITARE